MQTGKPHDENTMKKGTLLGEFAQFAVPASDMSPEQKRLVEERFAKNKLSEAVQEVLKHRDLQILTIEERIRFERKHDFTLS